MGSIIKIKNKNNCTQYKAVFDLPPTLDGKRRRTSKTFPVNTSLKFVKDFLNTKELERSRNTALSENYNLTFAQFTEEIYLKNYINFLSPSTIRYYKNIYFNSNSYGLKNYFGSAKLRQIETIHIQEWINFASNHLQPKSIKNFIGLLNQIFTLAVQEKIIQREANPMLGKLNMPRIMKKPVEAYTLEEINLLLNLAENDINPNIKLVIFLATLSGIRRGELVALRWENVNLKDGYIFIKESRVKAEKGSCIKSPKTSAGVRKIYIPQKLIDILLEYERKYKTNKFKLGKDYKDLGYVLCKENGEPFGLCGISNMYQRFMQRNSDKIRYLKFHGLRHSYASILIEQGENPKTVQHNLGHSNVALTLDVYSHSYENAQRNAAQKLDESIKNTKMTG